MKKSEIKIFKEEYEDYMAHLLCHQEKLKKCKDDSDKADIRADISSCRDKIELLKDLAFKFDLVSELGL